MRADLRAAGDTEAEFTVVGCGWGEAGVAREFVVSLLAYWFSTLRGGLKTEN
jgi:hypothetical protein